jgi:GTP1/Obg family GTP-binding protein
MVILYTEPVPLLSVLILSVLVIVFLFFIKVFISDRLLKKTIRGKPLILLLGPPNTGKKKLIEGLSKTKVKTKTYPFVGRFRTCDVHIRNKNYLSVCFHCVNKKCMLKKNSIKLFDKKPSLIIYAMRSFSDFEAIKKQGNILREINEMFPKVPMITVMNKHNATTRRKMKEIKRIFGKDFIDTPISKANGIEMLKKRVEKIGL